MSWKSLSIHGNGQNNDCKKQKFREVTLKERKKMLRFLPKLPKSHPDSFEIRSGSTFCDTEAYPLLSGQQCIHLVNMQIPLPHSHRAFLGLQCIYVYPVMGHASQLSKELSMSTHSPRAQGENGWWKQPEPDELLWWSGPTPWSPGWKCLALSRML